MHTKSTGAYRATQRLHRFSSFSVSMLFLFPLNEIIRPAGPAVAHYFAVNRFFAGASIFFSFPPFPSCTRTHSPHSPHSFSFIWIQHDFNLFIFNTLLALCKLSFCFDCEFRCGADVHLSHTPGQGTCGRQPKYNPIQHSKHETGWNKL